MCLFVDDAHHVGGSPEGARLLSRLVTDAPPAVHVVLASRRHVRGLARARLAGEVLDIGAADLSLSDAETLELARLHDVDPAVVASAGGWPAAAAMAAAYGIGGAEEYVFEAVLDHLGTTERTVLATAAAIGPAHPAVLRRAVGDAAIVPEEVLDGLPLVRRSPSGELAVHDLWRRVVDVDSDDVTAAVGRAVDAFVADGQFDRAFGLCAARGDWHGAAAVLTTCCRRGHVEVRPDVVVEWLELLPATWYEEPAGLLLRGLAGRVDDTLASARPSCSPAPSTASAPQATSRVRSPPASSSSTYCATKVDARNSPSSSPAPSSLPRPAIPRPPARQPWRGRSSPSSTATTARWSGSSMPSRPDR